jgi:hypothetical protein
MVDLRSSASALELESPSKGLHDVSQEELISDFETDQVQDFDLTKHSEMLAAKDTPKVSKA